MKKYCNKRNGFICWIINLKIKYIHVCTNTHIERESGGEKKDKFIDKWWKNLSPKYSFFNIISFLVNALDSVMNIDNRSDIVESIIPIKIQLITTSD